MANTQKIVPHFWFDTEAVEAARFYVDTFAVLGNCEILSSTTLHDTPSGDAETVTFQLAGYTIMAISAGPIFKINPSISLMVNFDPARDPQAREHLDHIWERLSDGGNTLMPLGEYPYSSRYGWIEDRFGISWQLILTDPGGEERPIIIPALLFTGQVVGKAEEAGEFYRSLFKDAKLGMVERFPAGMEPDKEGTIMFSDFQLENQWFVASDSAYAHDFAFNEAVSLLVRCETQAEIDFLWEKLSAVPEAEACGWLKDRYGVSWQIAPAIMDDMMENGTPEQIQRVTEAFLTMKKFDIAALEAAYRNPSGEN